MGMRYYIRETRDLIIRAFQNDDDNIWDEIDQINDENDRIMHNVFDHLMDGSIDLAYFHKQAGSNMILYTRSAKETGKIQRSVLWDRANGSGRELVPLSDQQYASWDDMKRDGYPAGQYVNVKTY